MSREWIVPDADLGCDGEYFDYKEVIRCKDCIHYEKATNRSGNCESIVMIGVHASDFCSFGERRADEQIH